MKRFVSVIVVLAVLVSSISVGGCKPGPDKEIDTPASVDESPATTQTDDAVVQDSIWDYIPLSFRKTDLTVTDGESRTIDARSGEWANTEWRYFHTPEALPTMRRHFTNAMPSNGWEQLEWVNQGDTSLSYWTINSGANEAVAWMVPEEPGTFIAVSAR